MRTSIAILTCIALIALGAGRTWGGENPSGDASAAYGRIIDKFSESCLFKTDLRHSKSRRVRNDATISCLKNSYWQDHKSDLIQAMKKEGIAPRKYKVRYFLNKRFFDHVEAKHLDLKATHPLAALPKTPPEGFKEMTLAEFCRHFSVPEKVAAEKLGEKRIEKPLSRTFKSIASVKEMLPLDVYRILR